ncbi:hypothetical protein VIGAN_UM151100 [Vigna angularis var. angularis]|uniref:Uncharacterized protein n=1 Tax=Vigna angularis var. angularis TaxID=157739 RepID=A0A0S3TEL4_PHAAN|nr:hypothetical protein VIGAN_UM127200 [Vigna angularis var. angularis]BAU03654.1 hypothetical protein VIGAN_UM151100 [Vigna angularis var. angularis]
MPFMLFSTFGIYENVINKHNDKLIQAGSKYPIHIIHKNCRSICNSKWHHHILIMPIARPKSCLLHIFRLD